MVNDRSNVVCSVQRITDFELRVGFNQAIFYIFVDAFVDNQAAR